jgi:hypothetical protein
MYGDGASCPGGPDSLRAGSAPVCLLKCRGSCAAEYGLAAQTGMWRKASLWSLHHYFLLESGRNNTNWRLEAVQSGCGSRARRNRKSRQLILCGRFAGLLAELVDPA